jgi:hypothetical protein
MITDWFKESFTIERSEWTTDDQNRSYSREIEVGTFLGYIQQSQPELVQTLGMTLTKPYTLRCPLTTDIKAGDTLRSSDAVYSVKAIQKNTIGDNKHIRAVVNLDKLVVNSGS